MPCEPTLILSMTARQRAVKVHELKQTFFFFNQVLVEGWACVKFEGMKRGIQSFSGVAGTGRST